MVATRNHPKDFPPPVLESPTKRSTRSSTASPPSPTKASSSTSSASYSLTTTTSKSTARALGDPDVWTHTPSNLTLIWLAISLPLVIWDTGYVLLRPHSMPGGWLHAPLWKPYELYGRIDHVYGWPAYEARNGWTAAQGAINAVETAAYLVYLALVYKYGEQAPVQGRGAPDKEAVKGDLAKLSESRVLSGRVAATAVLIAYSTALVTFAKTILYWLNEAFSGFHSIGHNTWTDLIFLWIIPNGAWIVFPAYMLYVFGQEILEGLETAVAPKSKSKKRN